MAASNRVDQPGPAAGAALLSLASHELRTPVSVVGGYLRMLREGEPPLDGRQRKMVEEAEKSCTRMAALIAELSEIARLDTDTAGATAASFDLLTTLEDVAATARESQDVEVPLQVVRDEATVTTALSLTGDLPRIRRAFAAFFRAVLREHPTANRVVAACRIVRDAANASAVIVIAPEGEIERAAGAAPVPFNEHRGGLGLALPIARRVIERHGGTVWSAAVAAESTAAPGSAIIVSLPLQDARR